MIDPGLAQAEERTMVGKRSDGARVTALPGLRRVMPFVMPTRAESQVFHRDHVDVEPLEAWLAARNARRPDDERATLLHAYLTAIARVLLLRPEANRFIAGQRTYPHDEIAITLAVKRQMEDAADLVEVRVVFTGRETVEETRDLIQLAIRAAREGSEGADGPLIDAVSRWPRPALRLLAWLAGRLDDHHLLPRAMIDAVPLFTSLYVAHIGSIGLDAPLHHLYRHGTASLFVTFGRARPVPVVAADGTVEARRCVTLGFTLDERISDGHYLARSLLMFQRLLEQPYLLDVTDLTVDAIMDVP